MNAVAAPLRKALDRRMSLADWGYRRAVFITLAVALPLLAAAIAFAVLMYPRCCGPAPSRPDFSWLTTAMQDCDAAAAEQPRTLYFLVIPMAAKAEDQERWRSKALNEVGNAILLTSNDTLDGLESGALKISGESYAFNVRDGANVLYNWNSSTGVARLTIPEADSIRAFNVQFQTASRTNAAAWGNVFNHRTGNCYWVNAIIGN
jgi:hypothetical protein